MKTQIELMDIKANLEKVIEEAESSALGDGNQEVLDAIEYLRKSLMKTKIELIGSDTNLETSLKEYGLAWYQSGDEFTFVYGVEVNESCEYIAFAECTLNANDFEQDFDWIEEKDWQFLYSFIGSNDKEFEELPFERKIESLMASYGMQDIFGSFYGNVMSFEELSETYEI